MVQPEEHGARTRATIREVASAAGVSIATVSRVLNGRPDVAPATREAVLRAVRDQRFSTNRSARALSGGRTGLVGVTLPVIEAAYFASILAGASEALHEQDMHVVLSPTLHLHDRAVNLLDLPQPPTAIFAFNDNMAIGVLRAARERGVSVPAELSVVGFDDSELAAIVTPALTTVRQPLAEMGRMAVSLLMRQLENQRVE